MRAGAVKTNFGHLEAAAGIAGVHQSRACGTAGPDSAQPQLHAMESGDRRVPDTVVRSDSTSRHGRSARPAARRRVVIRPGRDECAYRPGAGARSDAGDSRRRGFRR